MSSNGLLLGFAYGEINPTTALTCAQDILTVMTDILSIPVTVKMRTGLEDKAPIATKMIYNIRSWGLAGAVTVRLLQSRRQHGDCIVHFNSV